MDINEFFLGLRVTFIGMGIVFGALYGLQLVMYGLKAAFYKEPKSTSQPLQQDIREKQDVESQGLPTGLVAAISVAIACYMGGRPANIVSIQRAGDSKTPWQHAARTAPMQSRRSN